MILPDTKLQFNNGICIKNRFMLAPLTNQQSYENGNLSDKELNWLSKRAEGNFGLIMTCASHVQPIGKGFPGQLGIFCDSLNSGHKKLTTTIKKEGSLCIIQLHHAGMRSPYELINNTPVCPSKNETHNARALSLTEITQLKNDFILAATRAKSCGYDGIEVHGAHGYIIAQFLSAEINKRTDHYGGSLENRARLLFEIVKGIREHCGAKFLIGVRLSPEKFGMKLEEVKLIAQQLINQGNINFLDISLWDVFKFPEEKNYKEENKDKEDNDKTKKNKTLLSHFTSLNLKDVKLTVAGKIATAKYSP